MAKAPAHPLGPIVRGFPSRVFEEVAELLEARGIHRLDDLQECGDLLIRGVLTPCLIACLSFHYTPAMPVLTAPQAVPVLQKAACHAERATNWTLQRLIEAGLLGRAQMIGATQHEIAAIGQSRAHGLQI